MRSSKNVVQVIAAGARSSVLPYDRKHLYNYKIAHLVDGHAVRGTGGVASVEGRRVRAQLAHRAEVS